MLSLQKSFFLVLALTAHTQFALGQTSTPNSEIGGAANPPDSDADAVAGVCNPGGTSTHGFCGDLAGSVCDAGTHVPGGACGTAQDLTVKFSDTLDRTLYPGGNVVLSNIIAALPASYSPGCSYDGAGNTAGSSLQVKLIVKGALLTDQPYAVKRIPVGGSTGGAIPGLTNKVVGDALVGVTSPGCSSACADGDEPAPNCADLAGTNGTVYDLGLVDADGNLGAVVLERSTVGGSDPARGDLTLSLMVVETTRAGVTNVTQKSVSSFSNNVVTVLQPSTAAPVAEEDYTMTDNFFQASIFSPAYYSNVNNVLSLDSSVDVPYYCSDCANTANDHFSSIAAVAQCSAFGDHVNALMLGGTSNAQSAQGHDDCYSYNGLTALGAMTPSDAYVKLFGSSEPLAAAGVGNGQEINGVVGTRYPPMSGTSFLKRREKHLTALGNDGVGVRYALEAVSLDNIMDKCQGSSSTNDGSGNQKYEFTLSHTVVSPEDRNRNGTPSGYDDKSGNNFHSTCSESLYKLTVNSALQAAIAGDVGNTGMDFKIRGAELEECGLDTHGQRAYRLATTIEFNFETREAGTAYPHEGIVVNTDVNHVGWSLGGAATGTYTTIVMENDGDYTQADDNVHNGTAATHAGVKQLVTVRSQCRAVLGTDGLCKGLSTDDDTGGRVASANLGFSGQTSWNLDLKLHACVSKEHLAGHASYDAPDLGSAGGFECLETRRQDGGDMSLQITLNYDECPVVESEALIDDFINAGELRMWSQELLPVKYSGGTDTTDARDATNTALTAAERQTFVAEDRIVVVAGIKNQGNGTGEHLHADLIKNKYTALIKRARVCKFNTAQAAASATSCDNAPLEYLLAVDGKKFVYADGTTGTGSDRNPNKAANDMFGVTLCRGGDGWNGNGDPAVATDELERFPRTETEIISQLCGTQGSDSVVNRMCRWDVGVQSSQQQAWDALTFEVDNLIGGADTWIGNESIDLVVDVEYELFDCERFFKSGSGTRSSQMLRGITTHTLAVNDDSGTHATSAFAVATRSGDDDAEDGVHAGHAGDDTGAHSHDASAAAIVACCIGGVLLLIVSVHLVQVHVVGGKGLLSAESKARFEKKRRVDQKFNDQPSALLVPRKMIVPGRM